MSKENIEMVAIARFANWATQHHKDQMVKTMAAPIGSHDFYKNKCEMMSAYLSYIEEQISRPLIAARLNDETGEWLEMLYAVLPNGSVLKTDWGRVSDDFGSSKPFHKTELSLADIRGAAEFIGNYPIPQTRH